MATSKICVCSVGYISTETKDVEGLKETEIAWSLIVDWEPFNLFNTVTTFCICFIEIKKLS